jgi:hypothetical protein
MPSNGDIASPRITCRRYCQVSSLTWVDSPDVLGMLHSVLPHWVVLLLSGEQANGVGGQLQGVESAEWSIRAEQSPRSYPQHGIQRTQSPANASLAVGDEAPGSSSPYSGALGASRTAAPRTKKVSCNRPPEVPPTKYRENPLAQARQCGTVHSLRPRIRGKSSMYG